MIIREVRKVYHAAGVRRRRLTLKSACRDAAFAMWFRKYPCRCIKGTVGDPRAKCPQHIPHGGDRRRQVVARLARFIFRAEKRKAGK